MGKIKRLISGLITSLMLCSSMPVILADQVTAVQTNKGVKTITVNYSVIKKSLKCEALKFEKQSISGVEGYKLTSETQDLISFDSKATIDDSKKEIRLSYKNITYVFPYKTFKNDSFSPEGICITTPEGLTISFGRSLGYFSITYISAIKSASLSPTVMQNATDFTDYKEEFKKEFVRKGTLDEESIQQLLSYLYLDDTKNFNDLIDYYGVNSNGRYCSAVPQDMKSVEGDSEASDDKSTSHSYISSPEAEQAHQYLKMMLENYGVDFCSIENAENYDEGDANNSIMRTNVYNKLRNGFLDYLKIHPQINNNIVAKVDSAKTKVVTANCKGSVVNDNGYKYLLHTGNDYFTISGDENTSTNIFTDENHNSTIRIDNQNSGVIYIINCKSDKTK